RNPAAQDPSAAPGVSSQRIHGRAGRTGRNLPALRRARPAGDGAHRDEYLPRRPLQVREPDGARRRGDRLSGSTARHGAWRPAVVHGGGVFHPATTPPGPTRCVRDSAGPAVGVLSAPARGGRPRRVGNRLAEPGRQGPAAEHRSVRRAAAQRRAPKGDSRDQCAGSVSCCSLARRLRVVLNRLTGEPIATFHHIDLFSPTSDTVMVEHDLEVKRREIGGRRRVGTRSGAVKLTPVSRPLPPGTVLSDYSLFAAAVTNALPGDSLVARAYSEFGDSLATLSFVAEAPVTIEVPAGRFEVLPLTSGGFRVFTTRSGVRRVVKGETLDGVFSFQLAATGPVVPSPQ